MTLEEKYGIIYVGNKHYYKMDLSTHAFDLENSTPLYLKIEGYELYENAWTNLVYEVVKYIVEEFEYSQEELLKYELEWSKAKLFTINPKANYKRLLNGLYVNCNHTALHSCWVIQDFIKFSGIALFDCMLIVQKKACSEIEEVKKYYKQKHKDEFKSYVLYSLEKDLKYYEQCIKLLDATEVSFKKEYPTFESVYYFEEYVIYNNYKITYVNYLKNKTNINSNTVNAITKSLNIYGDFLKKYYK